MSIKSISRYFFWSRNVIFERATVMETTETERVNSKAFSALCKSCTQLMARSGTAEEEEEACIGMLGLTAERPAAVCAVQ